MTKQIPNKFREKSVFKLNEQTSTKFISSSEMQWTKYNNTIVYREINIENVQQKAQPTEWAKCKDQNYSFTYLVKFWKRKLI